MYKCRHFKIHELVSPYVYNTRGEKAWQLLDERGLITIDRLRDRYGKMTINNYAWGGDRKYSGLRISGDPHYSPFSQHSFGRGFDSLFENHDVETIRREILADPDHEDFKYIGALELGVTWLHFDTRNTDRILTFYP